MCVCVCRKEAKEFLRKVSDERVRAHVVGGSGSGSGQTTPTEGRSSQGKGRKSSEVSVSDGVQSQKKIPLIKLERKTRGLSSASDLSPLFPLLSPNPPLSPRLLEKCKSVKVRLAKCLVAQGREEEGEGETADNDVMSDSDNTLQPSQFYSPSTTEQSSTTAREASTTAREPSTTAREASTTAREAQLLLGSPQLLLEKPQLLLEKPQLLLGSLNYC